MSIVQERIQENERQLTLDRQSLAHMENSSWRHMDDLHCALGGVNDQGPSPFRAHNKAIAAEPHDNFVTAELLKPLRNLLADELISGCLRSHQRLVVGKPSAEQHCCAAEKLADRLAKIVLNIGSILRVTDLKA